MKKTIGILTGMGLLLAGVGAVAQSDLDVFPLGTTTMLYNVTSEDMTGAQTLELVVTAYGDDRYTVRMVTEQTGNEDELGTGFGFMFGAASVSSGGGHDADYSSLTALMDQRNRLQEGQDYLLPGGGSFENIIGITIAGVWCLQGTMIDEDDENVRMTIAFALTNPVYISPLIRAEELRDGEWVETFALELIEYTLVEGEG
ncbi:hypothetical protein IH601_02880 [Candidatus Bipolaricaulota bacterium]|nr:hypothetical protein [Candidatus Bipolaricaulota bacterium]